MIVRHEGVCPPAPWGLVENGPLVAVTLGHVDDYVGMEGRRPTNFPRSKMMIDTGAAFTLIEETIAVRLGFRPVRFREVIGVDQAPSMRPVFRMSIGLEVGDGLGNNLTVVFKEQVVGMPPPAHPEEYVGLLGRDFLRHFEFTYDGPNARFSLARHRSTRRKAPPDSL